MRVRATVWCCAPIVLALCVLTTPDSSSAGEKLFSPGGAKWYSSAFGDRDRPVEWVPAMLGDTFIGLPTIENNNNMALSSAAIPFPGGSDRVVVATNNSALTRCRSYASYEHTTGALRSLGAGPTGSGRTLDRVVVGLEYPLFDGAMSYEVRVPMGAQQQFSTTGFTIGGNGELGNVSLISKFQLSRTSMAASAAGFAVTLPTADDVTGNLGGTDFTIDNKAVIVSPYIAAVAAPNQDWFWQSFLQVDVATQDNDFVVAGGGRGVIENQTLARASLGTGYWFFQKDEDDCCMWRGLAGVVEAHYTSPLEAQDSVLLGTATVTQRISNLANRDDVINLSSGFHLQFPCATARVGVNVPVRQSQRFHDTTLMVQMNFGM